MAGPFLYFPADALSEAELSAAHLDGDLSPIGDAYMPTDAIESAALRAASLQRVIPHHLAVAGISAAWVHGATADAPMRHTVQRIGQRRGHHVFNPRLNYRDQWLSPEDVMRVGPLRVTVPARTLADLARIVTTTDPPAPIAQAVRALADWRPGLAAEAVALLRAGPALHHKRTAMAYLAPFVTADAHAAQDEVTRYTS